MVQTDDTHKREIALGVSDSDAYGSNWTSVVNFCVTGPSNSIILPSQRLSGKYPGVDLIEKDDSHLTKSLRYLNIKNL